MDLQKIPLFIGALTIGSFIIPMVWTSPGRNQLVMAAGYCLAAILSLRRVRLPIHFPLFALTVAAFLATWILGGAGSRIAAADAMFLVVASLVGLATVAITPEQEDWERFWRYLTRIVSSIALVAGSVGLVKLALATRGYHFPIFFDTEGRYIVGTATTSEYNNYAYSMALGLAALYSMRRSERAVIVRNLAEASIPIVTLAMLLTGSRRAVLFATTGAVFLLFGIIAQRRRAARHKPARRQKNHLAYVVYGLLLAGGTFQFESVIELLRVAFESNELEFVVGRGSMTFGSEGYQTRMPYIEESMNLFRSYSAIEKIFGRGFEYVFQISAMVGGLHSEEDYPHNFLISALLYGGFLQAGLICAAIGSALANVLRVRETLPYLTYMLLVTITFALVSSNTLFSLPISTFIVIVAGHPVFAAGPRHSRSDSVSTINRGSAA